MSMYSYCMFMYLHRASLHSSAALTEVFPCFFLNCKANARVKPAKTGHGPHSSKYFCVVLCILFVLCRSVYCLCVNVYCTTATGWQPNCSFNRYISKYRVREERNILHTVKRRKANWIGNVLSRNCLVKDVHDGKIVGMVKMAGRRRRRKQLLDCLNEKRGYWKLKDEALDRNFEVCHPRCV